MNATVTAIIGGSGSGSLLTGMAVEEEIELTTPYGAPSSAVVRATYRNQQVYVLYRHGESHSILPHKINYRANIWALAHLNVNAVIAIATVGGIRSSLLPGSLMVPDQLIDYTWGREPSFFDGTDGQVGHLEMTHPYCSKLREKLILAAQNRQIPIADGGTYAIFQGPRFETPAEINRIENDGGDVVGMTGMPEAALAGEKGLCYACVNYVVNPAAGRGQKKIDMDAIGEAWKAGNENLNNLLEETLTIVNASEIMSPDCSVMMI